MSLTPLLPDFARSVASGRDPDSGRRGHADDAALVERMEPSEPAITTSRWSQPRGGAPRAVS